MNSCYLLLIVDWLICRPPDKLSSFVINSKGVYYTSPIEWAASAIEMSLISGKNAALLVGDQLFDGADKTGAFDNDVKTGNDEL